MYREMTYASRPAVACPPISFSCARAHRFTCESRLMMKMPTPCDFDVGFMIHIVCGFLRNSSTKSEKSAGRMNVVGMCSKSSSDDRPDDAPPPPPAFASAIRSLCTRSSSLRYRFKFFTIRSLRVSS